jgi:hypothetical protein
MKTISLQERYAKEQYKMLCEAMDTDKLNAIAQAFNQLDNILRGINIESIEGPLEQARANAQKLLTGDQGILKKALGAIGIGGSGKLVQQIMNTQLQIASLLRALPKILVIAGRDLQQKIAQNPEASVSELFEEGGQTNRIYKMIAQALKPKMLEGGLAINPDAAAQDIMNLSGKDFLQLMQRSKTSNFKMPVKPEDVQTQAEDQGPNEAGQAPENPGIQHLGDLVSVLKTKNKEISDLLTISKKYLGKDFDVKSFTKALSDAMTK